MHTFIDKYRKPLLAVFGVLLMIIFMLPSNIRPGGDRNNAIIGHLGKETLRASDSSHAEQDWEFVTRRVVMHNSNAQMDPREPQWLPLAYAHLGPGPFQAIGAHRQAYLLLEKQAELHGVTVSMQEVNDVLESPAVGIVDRATGRVLTISDLENQDEVDAIRAAVGHLLMVERDFQAALDTIKISQPVRRQFLAQRAQTVSLNLISIPASQFPASTPTPAQLEEQFKKYADVDPNDIDKSPYGYGYRFPDRVKLQSIQIPAAQIRSAAERTRNKDSYEWERDAYKYYLANQSQFPTTAPAATTSSSTQPTTRPFAQVKEDAKRAVLDNDVTRLTQRVLERITGTMASDYVAYKNALTTGGQNAKPSASSLGVPYNSYDYLQRLAAQVQQSAGLLPPTNSFDKDFLTPDALASLPGLGTAAVDGAGGMPVVRYVFTQAQAFSTDKEAAKTLQLWEPSPVARDDAGNIYVFRLTDAQPAHAPKSLQEVAAAVEADVRAASSYAQAKKVADDLLAKARQSKNLESAAGQYKVQSLSGVRVEDPASIAPLNLPSPIAQQSFLRQTADLMGSISKDNPHPVGLIELPRDGRAILAQITDVKSLLTSPADVPMAEMQATLLARRILEAPLVNDWFRYDSIVARLNFTPTENSDRTNSAPSTPDNGPPANQPLL